MNKKRLFLSLLILLCNSTINNLVAQEADSIYNKVLHFPDKLFGGIDQKAAKLEKKFNKQTEKYLQKLEKQEKKLRRELLKKDSVASIKMFGDTKNTYDQLRQQLENPTAKLDKIRNVYDGHLDSLKTSMTFFQKTNLSAFSPDLQQKFSKSLGQLNLLQGKLNQTNQISKILQQRQQILKQQFQNLGLTKAYKKFQRDVGYYQLQIQEYKNLLDNPTKLESKAIEMATKLPAFKSFFANHSELAAIFKLPGADPFSDVDVAGLQTREAIETSLNKKTGNSVNTNTALEDARESAGAEIQSLKNNLKALESGSIGTDNISQPNFKPNNQKSKSFLKRLEFGTNIQTVKASYYFPAITDIGLSLGYKMNDKSVIGLGLSGKIGLGTGWDNIAISYEGVGIRQYVDVKLKGSIWVSGGLEANYRTSIKKIEVLKVLDDWQQSALLGLSKKIKVGKMKSQVQILYDFLWKQQRPVTQPFLFRLGYNFK